MDSMSENIESVKLHYSTYLENKEELTALFLEAFTTGEDAQYIPEQEAEKHLDTLFEAGSGWMLKSGDVIAGLLVSVTLDRDPEFPAERHSAVLPHQTLYVAELLVNSAFRGRGLGRKLMEKLIEQAHEEDFEEIVIRVWDKNRAAVKLYLGLGFEQIDTIVQLKRKSAESHFEMKKLYLTKKL